MKNKHIALAVLSCAVVGMMGLSSCESMKKLGGALEDMGLNPFEPTDDVPGRVIFASVPVYHRGGDHVMGKGKGAVYTQPHWSQNVTVKTNDGKVYKGSLSLDTRAECVSSGSKGIAKITRRSKVLRSFQANY